MPCLLNRLLPLAIVHGLIGLVATVAVAWACAHFVRMKWMSIEDAPLALAREATERVPGVQLTGVRCRLRGIGVHEDRAYISHIEHAEAAISIAYIRDLISDTMEYDWQYAADSSFPHIKHIRAGFPFLCFEDWWYPWRNAMYAEIVSGSIEPEPGRIPVTPMPLPLLANTAIYAAASWSIVALLARARGAIRSRRGHCPRCGYALADAPICPECGTRTPRYEREGRRGLEGHP